MSQTRVLGVGHYLPPMTDWAGVRRPIEAEPSGTSELGARASRMALERIGMSPADVDFIIFATFNPDVTFPGAACYLQDKLGCDTVGALDIRAQCAGFVFGLSIADQFVRADAYRRVLLVGAEMFSVWVDPSPAGAEMAARLGDGAGAIVVGPGASESRLLATVTHTDGARHDRFWCEYPASRQHPVRMTVANLEAGLHFPRMDVDAMHRLAIEALPSAVREVAARAGISVDAIDCFIFGHVLPGSVWEAVGALGLARERVVNPAERYGHLGGAALPVALSEEIAAGRVRSGNLVCLAAAGAGVNWGAALLRL